MASLKDKLKASSAGKTELKETLKAPTATMYRPGSEGIFPYGSSRRVKKGSPADRMNGRNKRYKSVPTPKKRASTQTRKTRKV